MTFSNFASRWNWVTCFTRTDLLCCWILQSWKISVRHVLLNEIGFFWHKRSKFWILNEHPNIEIFHIRYFWLCELYIGRVRWNNKKKTVIWPSLHCNYYSQGIVVFLVSYWHIDSKLLTCYYKFRQRVVYLTLFDQLSDAHRTLCISTSFWVLARHG